MPSEFAARITPGYVGPRPLSRQPCLLQKANTGSPTAYVTQSGWPRRERRHCMDGGVAVLAVCLGGLHCLFRSGVCCTLCGVRSVARSATCSTRALLPVLPNPNSANFFLLRSIWFCLSTYTRTVTQKHRCTTMHLVGASLF